MMELVNNSFAIVYVRTNNLQKPGLNEQDDINKILKEDISDDDG